MDVTSEEIRSSRFQGTRHVYDRREVDAFLHRAAATLEVYERKLAVTESHVQSLEKALDLANSRVRSVRQRDARIGELETALASAQHHYELEVERTEANAVAPIRASSDREATEDSQRRSEEIIDEARQKAEAIRTRAVDYTEQASDEAEEILAAARAEGVGLIEQAKAQEAEMLKQLAATRAEAVGLIEQAKAQEAEMLKQLAATRADAVAALEAEAEAQRTSLSQEVAANDERLAGMEVVASAEMAVKLREAEERAAKIASKGQEIIQQAEERAQAAEAERNDLAEELQRAAAEAEASRIQLMADVEIMVAEAVTQAEADRDLMLLEAQVRLEAAEGEREALIELARSETSAITTEAEQQLESLRRQAAQMRTALSDLHGRFADLGSLTVEDFELATALVDLDLRDVDEVLDLTAGADQADQAETAVESDEAPRPVGEVGTVLPLKSKWSQPATAAPRGLVVELDEAATQTEQDQNVAPNGEYHPTWRDKLAPQPPAKEEPEEEVKEVLGFYERRLAGLRARLQEALPDEY
ncbi:MAG: hypothetical protein GY720_12760 [bacterium]|nr:hypothetical protein [bacterium]